MKENLPDEQEERGITLVARSPADNNENLSDSSDEESEEVDLTQLELINPQQKIALVKALRDQGLPGLSESADDLMLLETAIHQLQHSSSSSFLLLGEQRDGEQGDEK